jgi:plastocyanin
MARRMFLSIAVALLATTWAPSAALAGGGGGCYAPASDGSGSRAVIEELCFTPTVLHVDPGSTVTWINRDRGIPHTVTGANRAWGSLEDLRLGDEATFRFDRNGVYPYYCVYHPGMTGAVVVGDGSGSGVARNTGVELATESSPVSASSERRATASGGRAATIAWAIGGLALGIVAGGFGAVALRRRFPSTHA